MKNCINVRMHTDNGWRDIPCEKSGKGYVPVPDRDGMIDREAIFNDNVGEGELLLELDDHTVFTTHAEYQNFEVTWQSDIWP